MTYESYKEIRTASSVGLFKFLRQGLSKWNRIKSVDSDADFGYVIPSGKMNEKF